MVQAPGGRGRVYGDPEHEGKNAIAGSHEEIAHRLAAFAAAGVEHMQLVVDPITQESIEWLAPVVGYLDEG